MAIWKIIQKTKTFRHVITFPLETKEVMWPEVLYCCDRQYHDTIQQAFCWHKRGNTGCQAEHDAAVCSLHRAYSLLLSCGPCLKSTLFRFPIMPSSEPCLFSFLTSPPSLPPLPPPPSSSQNNCWSVRPVIQIPTPNAVDIPRTNSAKFPRNVITLDTALLSTY